MSFLNLRLDWNEEPSEAGNRQGDRFEGLQVDAPSQATVEEQWDDEIWEEADFEEFEYSESRADAIDAALDRIQGVVGAPILRYISSLAKDYGFISPEDFQARCNAAEAWLAQQIGDWQRTGRVLPEDDSEESIERAGSFNYALSVGSDALHLCSEIVDLLRGGQASLALKLVDQVETNLNQCREALVSLGI